MIIDFVPDVNRSKCQIEDTISTDAIIPIHISVKNAKNIT
jgi:hypothetical protein